MAESLKTYIVDSFTEEPFKGNPAGVCLVEDSLSDKKMLSIAKELGHSETAFIKALDGTNHYSIRYFSPKMEIPLCGHATLASSAVLFHTHKEMQSIHFRTIQNLDLTIERKGLLIRMEFPVYETTAAKAPEDLLSALGIGSIQNCEYNVETNILLLEIESCDILQSLAPDFEALVRSHKSINGVLITAPSNKDDFDFESRYFWPWSGTNEDPVTGGTHTFLTEYWSQRLGKTNMRSFQCSERSGFMNVELTKGNKLIIGGMARIVLEGDFFL